MSLRSAGPILYLITRGEATPANFTESSREILDIVRVAVKEKVGLIQIREKQLTARRVFELTIQAVGVTRETSTRLLVNDRADIALAAGADGVHLTANSLGVDVIRDNFPKEFVIGASVHSLRTAEMAAQQGADFIVFAPVFKTPGKAAPHGLEALNDVCDALRPFPVLALGGVDETNCESVLASGASGFAAIRSLNDPGKLHEICQGMRNIKNAN
ncbi:MAG: thiamine phosphate synthase [Pyrinomonadaceae bacterium]